MSSLSKAMLIGTLAILSVVGYLTYIATNVTMTIEQAGLLTCLFVIFGALAVGGIGGTIGSFFEEEN